MSGPRRYLIITLAATYPDGAVGYVTGRYSTTEEWTLADLNPKARAPLGLINAIDGMLALYRSEIGDAYAMQDFTFTIHEAEDRMDLFFLMGAEFLRREGVSGTMRPNLMGVSVL
jgi:hypothetical protein